MLLKFSPDLRLLASARRWMSDTAAVASGKTPNPMHECAEERIISNCKNDTCALPPLKHQPCIIIIGAGMAGLSAAHRLIQCGLSNFKILEARDRPGGRIKSCWLGDTVVEVGADTINGASIVNPVYALASQEKLIKHPLSRIKEGEAIFFTSDGRALDLKLTKKAAGIFSSIKKDVANLSSTMGKPSKESLGDYMDKAILKHLSTLPPTERFDTARIFYGLNTQLKGKLGADLNEVGAATFSAQQDLPGGNVKIPLGMGALMAPMIRDLPLESLRFCKPVHTIRWGTAGKCGPRAVVLCCDGEEYPADYVIVTVPLGVLRNKSATFFCPNLPSCKTEAIKKLGLGHLSRIFMEMKSPFWVGSGVNYNFAWSPQELKDTSKWTTGITGVSSVPGSSRVLSVTMVGSQSKDMEAQSDAAIASTLTKLIRQFLGDQSIPAPKEILRSDWSSNIFSLGAVTYMGLESNPGHIACLAEPMPGMCDGLPPIILFAGEHTSYKYFGTVHGARESGIREADRIIELTRKLRGPPIVKVCVPCVSPC